ncbi:hypothetical protein NT6N_22050 [Oceaniferula spumae]|uniref:Uncharacterized protein n=1 Tax=Oceaniferula spumae TaxID=2979115 RepID=A0AAT9FMB4_9BACT
MDYKNLPDAAKAKGEYQFLKQGLTGAPHGIHQGIYVVSPGGKYLKQCNVGWPKLDPVKALENMKQALAEFRSMPKSERLATTAMKESDRSMPVSHHLSPAPEWLKIRSTTRSYDFADMEYFDQRHPDYYKIDRLWMTPETTRTLLPEKLEVGETRAIEGRALNHLVYDCHLMLGCPPWPEESIKTAKLDVKVVGKKGSLVDLRYAGDFHFDSDSKWNKSAYRGKLLGKAVWDEDKKKFTSLTWVSLGQDNKRELKPNETRGKVHITTVGSVLELDPRNPNDLNILPHRWKYGYPKEMKQKLGAKE